MLWGAFLTLSCQTPARPAAKALRMAFEAAPTRLDPRFATDAYSQRIVDLVFASLLRPAEDGSYRSYLATDWQPEGDLQWRFRLRSDIRFHDGTPLTAGDVVATYRALLDPKLASPHRAALDAVDSVMAPDSQHLVFHLRRRDAAFLQATTIGLLPARQADAGPLAAQTLVGSGPYRIAEARDDGSVSLQAVADFADGRPPIDQIEIRIIPDSLMRALELRHHTIDFLQNALDPDTVAWLTARAPKDLKIYRSRSSNVQYLGMSMDNPLLADLRVRRAIAYGIDRNSIVEHMLVGQARPASGLLPPQHWAYNGKVRRYDYRPARARHLLDRAGLHDPDGAGPRPRFTLNYKTTTQELPRRVAEAIAAQLERVGIRLSIETYEWGTFYHDIRRGSFHLYSLQWVGLADPDIYRRIYHSQMTPPAGNNRGRYRNKLMDRLTERAAACGRPERRKLIYGRVQRLAARRLPMIPLWWPDRIVVTNWQLDGFRPDPGGGLLPLAELRGARPLRSN